MLIFNLVWYFLGWLNNPRILSSFFIINIIIIPDFYYRHPFRQQIANEGFLVWGIDYYDILCFGIIFNNNNQSCTRLLSSKHSGIKNPPMHPPLRTRITPTSAPTRSLGIISIMCTCTNQVKTMSYQSIPVQMRCRLRKSTRFRQITRRKLLSSCVKIRNWSSI